MFVSRCDRVVACECETHCTSRAALERAMHRTCVAHKVGACPRVSREKLEREQIALEPVARAAGDDKVARIVRPAAREREHVIERCGALIEMRGAVYTTLPAVAQCSTAHRAFERRMDDTARTKFDEVSRS